MSWRVSRIQRHTTTRVITTPMPQITQDSTTPVIGEREPERREHRQVGRAGQVHGLARGRGRCFVGVNGVVGHQ